MNSTRELNRKELKQLQKRVTNLNKNTKTQNKILIGGAVIIIIFSLIVHLNSNTIIALATFGIYFLIAFWVYIEALIKNSKQLRSIEQTIEKNIVFVTKVESRKFIQLDEEEDEGFFYLFELNNKKTISIGGQENDPSKKFPNDNFEIAIAKDDKKHIILLERYDMGDKINPTKRIKGREKWKLLESVNYPNPEEFEIIDVNLESVESYIKSEKIHNILR